jgi:hypothetical protein
MRTLLFLLLPLLTIFSLRLTAQSKALSPAQYDALTLRDKIAYDLNHPKSYSQMCSAIPFRDSSAWRIYSNLPPLVDGLRTWSESQRDLFSKNRDSTIQVVMATIGQNGAGVELLTIIVDLNAKELIPLLIDSYHSDRSNHYILTALLLLMSNNDYSEFLRSQQYAQLYSEKLSARIDYLPYTTKNIDFILQQATSFYHASVRQ